VGTDAAGIETGSAAMADLPSIPNKSLRISIARPFEARSSAKTIDGSLPGRAITTVLNKKRLNPQRQKDGQED
jgi:hypothetical protein